MVLPLVTLLDDRPSCRGLLKAHWHTVKGTVSSKQLLEDLPGRLLQFPAYSYREQYSSCMLACRECMC